MSDVWRCEQCQKMKDLNGPHLNGRSSVRSDCWPCAKKTTFVRCGADGTTAAATTATPTSTPGVTALPVSIAVTPSDEAQAAAFQNIYAAATAAAATAQTAANTATTTAKSSLVFPLHTTHHNGNPISHQSSSSNAVATHFGTSRTPLNPFFTPAVSAASIKKFQVSYANVMTAKHEDPTHAPAATTAALGAGKSATASASAALSPQSSSPCVMESSAGTSPPFTFRPNANYIPAASSGSVWSTATLLPGSTAAATTTSASRALSPSMSLMPVDAAAAPNVFAKHAEVMPSSAITDAGSGAAPTVARATTHGAAAAASSSASLWVCDHCHKAKDLKGDHLRGKATVRSDCWPCGKKRTFVLRAPSAMAATTGPLKLGGGGGSRTASAASAVSVPTAASSAAASSSVPVNPFITPPMLGTSPRVNSTNVATVTTSALAGAVAPSGSVSMPLLWVLPAIPSSPHMEESCCLSTALPHAVLPASFFGTTPAAAATTNATTISNLNGSAASLASSSAAWIVGATTASTAAGGRDSEANIATYYAAMARFDQQLLKSFRERLVGGTQLRAVWSDRVLYVIAEDNSADAAAATTATGFATSSSGTRQAPDDLVGAFAELGRYAALYLAVEQKLAASRFRHIGRLFCPNEFAFAAACCYANNFFAAETAASAATLLPPPSTATSKFKVYGPQTDPTKSLSLWGRVVAESPVAHRCVVSEEQRVVAAQTLYRRVSWLAAPQTMTATAIQLSVETESTADEHGVDVVLLTGTMKLEELPQAVPLAQLPHPYA
ncbi:hypothetical protein ABB37_00940 [Leptomonas pyrrhocoris]|uniref:Uncharacterized protein n=1 Tax=Leptomonas pyrrhocoris TaxID=157538 RepID=A0A0N0E0W0_LEPPY|nr:hypothetical protein ABB37_00940 [Leptomonas pyrrhocoris]XP_015665342.1 hypothetical protein ABB37_00940 [Leptomonas pyrrhocoris]KPA86902.1 hypothetical protein ABB37_00940 [Leptomonas pyrrhocoris]KPA86903.1 hypothetical protein ABB37_00940 [Leptomonas pyrrhocoris]|eukprot:XP_015665341.1 hypothetical protein ABB37_00940 [Leptomonas pyrrhocoris]